jgi:hypothetical protein
MKKIFIGLLMFGVPLFANAQMTSLNGQTGATQTFANDTNITISSSGDVHTLGWSGVLQPSRGGTGVDMSGFNTGSLLFFDGSDIAESSNINWDDVNLALNLGGSILFGTDPSATTRQIKVGDQTTSDVNGNDIEITPGKGNGIGSGGNLVLESAGTDSGDSGGITLQAAPSNLLGHAGSVGIFAGDSYTGTDRAGDIGIATGNAAVDDSSGGNLELVSGYALGTGEGGSVDIFSGSNLYGSGNGGTIQIKAGQSGATGGNAGDIILTAQTGYQQGGNIIFQAGGSSMGAPGTFSFFGQNPTLNIGSGGSPACIAMEDDDGGGITYVTAHRGVLSAATTKPSNCQ